MAKIGRVLQVDVSERSGRITALKALAATIVPRRQDLSGLGTDFASARTVPPIRIPGDFAGEASPRGLVLLGCSFGGSS